MNTRTPKFRAWDVKRKRFGYVTLHPGLISWPEPSWTPSKVMDGQAVNFEDYGDWEERTGLQDKNGVDIYEGDILSFDGHMTADNTLGVEPNGFIYDETSIHPVVWSKEIICGFTLDFGEFTEEDCVWKYKRDTYGLFLKGSCEIIGNIHKNAELLDDCDTG